MCVEGRGMHLNPTGKTISPIGIYLSHIGIWNKIRRRGGEVGRKSFNLKSK